MTSEPIYTLEDFEVLLTEAQIRERVEALGREITGAMQGQALTVIGVLKGSFLFMADLVRAVDLPLTCDFLRVSSYEGGTHSTGVVRIDFDATQPMDGRQVLLVEDIIDTGLTMKYLLEYLALRKPASLGVCSLLHKSRPSAAEVPIEFLGFEIPDRFVIGYGLDYMGLYRDLRDIRALKPEALERTRR